MSRKPAKRRRQKTSRRRRRRHQPFAQDCFSIDEFCESHGISRATFYRQRELGLTPDELKIGSRTLIPIEAAAAWRRQSSRPPKRGNPATAIAAP
jgi:hypothetical protein